MPRILLIDDDAGVRVSLERLLTSQEYECVGTGAGAEGIRLAQQWKPDVVFVDLRLSDMSGVDVLVQLAASCPTTARILFTGQATLELAINAMRRGCDCVTKPALQREIVAAVERALERSRRRVETAVPEPRLTPPEAHAAIRWADPITRLIDASQDPRTLREFGRAVFVSVGCFRNWCRTNRVRSRASLEFARALRAVYRFENDRSTRPENLLSIVDQRTLAKFVKKCGGHGDRLPESITEFLERQLFIDNIDAVDAVRAALRSRDLPRAESAPSKLGIMARA